MIAYIVIRKNTITNEKQNCVVCESESAALDYIRNHHNPKSMWTYDYLPIHLIKENNENV